MQQDAKRMVDLKQEAATGGAEKRNRDNKSKRSRKRY
jgi:hypothetical protein